MTTAIDATATLRDQMSAKMKTMEATAKGSFRKMKTSAGTYRQGLHNVMQKAVSLKNVLIGFVGLKVFQALIGETAKFGDTIDKMSQRLGVSTKFLQELDFAAGLAGSSAQEMQAGLRRLAKSAADSERGLITAQLGFEKVGVSVRDAGGEMKTVEQLFTEVVAGLGALESETERVALAQDLLGRAGTALLPIVNMGADAYGEAAKEANRLGIVLDSKAIKATVDYTDAMHRLNAAFRGVKMRFLVPIIRDIADETQAFVDKGGFDQLALPLEMMANTFRITAAIIGDAWNGIVVIVQGLAVLILEAINDITGSLNWMIQKVPDKFIPDGWKESIQDLADHVDTAYNTAVDDLLVRTNKMNQEGSKLGQTFQGIADRAHETGVTLRETNEELSKTADNISTVVSNTEEKEQALTEFLNQQQILRNENLAQTFEGRQQLLDEQHAEMLERAMQLGQDTTEIDKHFDRKRQQLLDERDQKELTRLMKNYKAEKAIFDRKLKETQDRDAKSARSKAAGKKAEEDLAVASINAIGAVASAADINAKVQHKIALAGAIVSGILAVQRTLAHPPGPPTTVPMATLIGVKTAANIAAIAAQSFQEGGFPGGRNAFIRVNEDGQESILNARATAGLGIGGVNALNSGQTINKNVTNEISYSPTIQIDASVPQDVVNILREDKENFADFLQNDIIGRGYTDE